MDKTIKLYDSHPYDSSFTAHVISCSEMKNGLYDLVLDATLFFPEEGGQHADEGTLSYSDRENHTLLTATVSAVSIQDDIIHHESASLIPVGAEVTGTINFEKRYSNMQNHSGEHILSGLVHSLYGFNNVGFHLSDSEVTADYDGVLTEEDAYRLELEVNRAIQASIPIDCRYLDDQELAALDYRSKKELSGPVRIVTIPGFDICACCAPHVRSTSEIGLFKILSVTSYKGGVRISMLSGRRAFDDYVEKQRILKDASTLLKVPITDVTHAIQKLFLDRDTLRQDLKTYQAKQLKESVESVPEDLPSVWLFTDAGDPNLIRQAVNSLCASHPGYSAIFWSDGNEGFRYIIGASTMDGSNSKNANEVNSILKDTFGARGGGKPEMVQGSLSAKKEEILSALNNL